MRILKVEQKHKICGPENVLISAENVVIVCDANHYSVSLCMYVYVHQLYFVIFKELKGAELQ